MDKWKSLLDQNEELKKKWGGDTLNYDIKSAISGYQPALKEWNDATTTAERKAEISSIYGDITKWDNETAYHDYMSDVNYIRNIDALNTSATGAMDAAKQAESRAMQYADTRRQLMQKYIPETLLAQGMANTGYTAQALLDAENKYNQYVHGAMSNRATAEQNTMKGYQDALRTYKTERDEKAYERFLQEQANAETTARDQKTAYANFAAMIDEGADIDSVVKQAEILELPDAIIADLRKYDKETKTKVQDELVETYINTAGHWTKEQLAEDKANGNLTEQQYNALLNAYYIPPDTAIKGEVAATNRDGTTDEGRDLIYPPEEGDVFGVSVNGKRRNLKTGDVVPSTSAVYKFVEKNKISTKGQVFMYDGKLYVTNGKDKIQYIKEDVKDYGDVLEYFKS